MLGSPVDVSSAPATRLRFVVTFAFNIYWAYR